MAPKAALHTFTHAYNYKPQGIEILSHTKPTILLQNRVSTYTIYMFTCS